MFNSIQYFTQEQSRFFGVILGLIILPIVTNSDVQCFIKKDKEKRMLELVCKVYNINKGMNQIFFTSSRSEVLEVTKVDYTFERRMELNYEEGREDEKVSSLRSMMKNLKMSAEEAMETLDIPESERSKYMARLK